MTWYTVEDIQLEFDDLPVKFDDQGIEVIDVNLINSSLLDSQNLIMSYLRKMKTLRNDTPSDLVILELKSTYLEIARYKYNNKSNTLTELVIDRYKLALEYLREIASGKVILGEVPTKVGLINRRLQRG